VGVARGDQCSLLRLAEPQPRRLCDLGHPRSQHIYITCRSLYEMYPPPLIFSGAVYVIIVRDLWTWATNLHVCRSRVELVMWVDRLHKFHPWLSRASPALV
jgi:hypothetical protein